MSSRTAAGTLLAVLLALPAAGAEPLRPGAPAVAVHVVEEKPWPDQGKVELVLYPVVPQVNGRFTDHLGTMGAVVWHLQENFGLLLSGGGNWLTRESAFNAELAGRARVEAQAASSLLWTWGLLAGLELSPLYGKFAWFDDGPVHFSVVISGGAGAGGTRHQLKPAALRTDGSVSPASFGDTGLKFLGTLGLGLRLRLGSHLALRLELKDVLYTARVEQVNGCGRTDLQAMEAQRLASLPLEDTPVGAGCDLRAFLGRTPGGDSRSVDVPLALQLVTGTNGVPSSDVLNNLGVYLGLSVLF